MRIALAQTTTGIDPAAEATRLAALVAEAAARGADMLFTPEMSGLLDRDRRRAAAHITDEAHDPALAAVRAAATEHGLWVHLGSLALKGESEKYVNQGYLVRPDGSVAARYAKIHLFDVELGSESWRESAAYAPGVEAVLAQTPWGGLGLSVCYDLRFPALYRALAQAGAAMLSVPAAFTRPTGRAHWHVLLRARAIETGCFVIAAAQTGEHQDGRATWGHSLIVSPWGEVLLDMGEAPGLAVLDIDLAEVEKVRARLPSLAHDRPFKLVRA